MRGLRKSTVFGGRSGTGSRTSSAELLTSAWAQPRWPASRRWCGLLRTRLSGESTASHSAPGDVSPLLTGSGGHGGGVGLPVLRLLTILRITRICVRSVRSSGDWGCSRLYVLATFTLKKGSVFAIQCSTALGLVR